MLLSARRERQRPAEERKPANVYSGGSISTITITLNPAIDKTFTVDRMVCDRKLKARGIREYPGGGGINVARALRNLGCDTLALWSGGGHTGLRMRELLEQDGVSQRMVEFDGQLRENLMVAEEASEDHYRFGMPGPTFGQDDLTQWKEQLERIDTDPDYFVVSGSLPGDTSLDWYEKLLRLLAARAPLVVDTKGQALRTALKVGLSFCKPNLAELEKLAEKELQTDDEIIAAARQLIRQGGARGLLVSLGRAGAYLLDEQQAFHLPSPSVKVKSKVGAGDSMVAGLVYGFSRGLPLAEAAHWGVAAGAAAVMEPGTELCQKHNVERLVRSIHHHPVKE